MIKTETTCQHPFRMIKMSCFKKCCDKLWICGLQPTWLQTCWALKFCGHLENTNLFQQQTFLHICARKALAHLSQMPSWHFNSLASPNQQTKHTNKNPPLDKIYPHLFQAPHHAGQITKKVPALTEQLQHNEEAKALEQAKNNSNNERNRRRTTNFCIVCSNIWSKPVHSIIKSVKDKINLQWLRASMSCHRFNNLGEIFQEDLSRKLTVGLTFQDFELLPCNCRTGGNGVCGYNNMRKNSTPVCEVKSHMGNTQQKFKARMQQHFNEVQKLVKLGEKSDLHAKHFATQSHDANPSSVNQRGRMACNIIWQGNPIIAVKTVATKNCALHVKERIAILKQSRCNPQLLVNSNNEICGACGHGPCFHRCAKHTSRIIDESMNDKRVSPTQSHHRFYLMQCLSSWCLFGSTVRTNKKKSFLSSSFPEH